jgi:hypothetical protein
MSKDNQPDGRVQDPQIAGIRCHDRLFAAAGTDHDVGVGDISGPAGGQEPAGIRCIHPVQGDDVVTPGIMLLACSEG